MHEFDLGPETEATIARLVASGRFASTDEVIREAVEAVVDREERLTELDAAIAEGLADIDAGRTVDAEDAFARLERKYLDMVDKAA